MKISKAAAYALHALMYMVRHITQLPATTGTIAKAEGIPAGYMAKIFHRLVKANFVKAVKGRKRGYVFARPPEEISLLNLFETIEGRPLFNDCPLRYCECGGTPATCRIYSIWMNCGKKMSAILSETSLADATWNHPEHRFYSLPKVLETSKDRPRKKTGKK